MEKKIIQIDPRAYNLMKSSAVTNIYDALIELITNSDDAYGKSNIKNNRLIQIEIHYAKISDPQHSGIVVVRDHALGMSFETMEKCFLQVGKFTSDNTSRGFFSRGAKDITALGNVVFESIYNNHYSKLILDTESYAQIFEQNVPVTTSIRETLKMPNNGLQVSIYVDRKFPIHNPEIISEELPKIISLRNIFNSNKNNINLSTFNYLESNEFDLNTRLRYTFPEGVPVLDIIYDVPAFNVEAQFTVFKASKPFEKPNNFKLTEYGFIITSEKVIHDVETFEKDLQYNPDLKLFYGYIHCDYINTLLRNYDISNKDKLNPFPIIDPNRINGITKNHPFFKRLIELPLRRIKLLLEEIEDNEASDSLLSVDLSDFSQIIHDLNVIDGTLIKDDKSQTFLVSDQRSKLIKAIESERGKFVKVEKNYSIPLKKLKLEPFKWTGGDVVNHPQGFHFNKPKFLDEPDNEDDDYKIYNEIDSNDINNEFEMKQLYVYDRLSDKKNNPTFESQNWAHARPKVEFKILFKHDTDLKYKFMIKRTLQGITIKINSAHPILTEHIKVINNELDTIEPEGIILIHDIFTEAFSRLMLQKDALMNKELFVHGEAIEAVEKIYDSHDKKALMIEEMVYKVIKKMLSKKKQEYENYEKIIQDKVNEEKNKIENVKNNQFSILQAENEKLTREVDILRDEVNELKQKLEAKDNILSSFKKIADLLNQ
jgi:hypothetical protein